MGDRESDIYELFCTAQEVGTLVLVRACVDRLASRWRPHRGRGDAGSTGGKRKRYPELTLTVLHAQERDTPTDREKIDWKLITDLPVRSPLGGPREAGVVRVTLEDRRVSQDPQVGLQSRVI